VRGSLFPDHLLNRSTRFHVLSFIDNLLHGK
jgi:hypothetical protein